MMKSAQFGDDGHVSDEADRAVDLRRLMWLLTLLFVAHGSLFPWQFASPASWHLAFREMFVERMWWTGRGDAIGNVLLFIPVGAFGMLLGDGSTRSLLDRGSRVTCWSVLFAFGLQVAQLWLPHRTAALSDVLWNTAGTISGVLMAPVLRPILNRSAQLGLVAHRGALAISVVWLAVQCWPLMPAHSLRHVVTAMRPMLLPWKVDPVTTITTALSLAATLGLSRNVGRPLQLGAALALLSACGLMAMRHHVLTPSHLLGWSLGIMLAHQLVRLPPRSTAGAVGLCAVAGLALGAVLPWGWSPTPADFHWVPLLAPLQSARVVHTQELAWVLFWCGALMLAARGLGWPVGSTAIGLTLAVLAIEVAQRWQPAQLADITAVLIPAFWWWVWRRWPPRDR